MLGEIWCALAMSAQERVWFSQLCGRKVRVLECQLRARKGMGFLVFVPVHAVRVQVSQCCHSRGIPFPGEYPGL